MHTKLQSLILIVALTTATSASPSDREPLAAMLDRVGGEPLPAPEDAKNESGLRPLLWPVREVPQFVVGSRYFAEKRLSDGTATAEQARKLFAEQCLAEGGRMEPAESNAAKMFADWATTDRLPTTRQYKHRWLSITGLCTTGPDRFLGGFYAAIFDTTGVATDGDIGSRVMMRAFPIKTLTTIYIFQGEQITRQWQNAKFDEQHRAARLRADHAEEVKLTAELRGGVKVGSETNCGTVIEVRPPLVQIAVPATMQTPNGQATFWSRIDRLVPHGFGALCSFGL